MLPTSDEAVAEIGALPRFSPYDAPGQPPRFIGGTPEQVRETLERLGTELGVEEMMVQDIITDHGARLRSYELLADIFGLEGN
jgi:alkanesulfonate monooxygenase SsuD/methylene tetrahydromethanopterin reductase-like flavin-dependent oxidoreductase (luciferase family)